MRITKTSRKKNHLELAQHSFNFFNLIQHVKIKVKTK